MRIISQDGKLDMPYEICAICVEITLLRQSLQPILLTKKRRNLWKYLENSTKNTLEILLIYMAVFSFRTMTKLR